MSGFLPVGVDKVSAEGSKRCAVGVVFAPQRLAESLGRSGTLTSLRVRVEDVAVRRVQTMKRRSRKFLVQTTGKWRVFRRRERPRASRGRFWRSDLVVLRAVVAVHLQVEVRVRGGLENLCISQPHRPFRDDWGLERLRTSR